MIDTDELRQILAANLSRLRKERNLSQTELAERIGVSLVHLNRIENGHASPSAELLYAVADALGVTTDSLRQIPSKGA